jgi:hypothetical protein
MTVVSRQTASARRTDVIYLCILLCRSIVHSLSAANNITVSSVVARISDKDEEAAECKANAKRDPI